MKNHLKAMATCILVTAMATAHAQTATSSGTAGTKKPVRHRTTRKPARPSVELQIQQLRQDMETQINQLKQQLTDSQSQLQAAQQQAAAANAAAAQTQQAAQQQQQQTAENAAAVSSLQGAVTDLKSNSTSLASSIQETQTNILKKVESPDAIHFKGATISPTGSFLAAETVWRARGIGSDINTPFSATPLNHSEAGQLSEFFGSGRQSRVALLAEGKVDWATLRGYYEADWLSAGVTSNNNQSNSYTMRQRQLWAQAALNNGVTFTGGQQWSLVTETRKGMDNRTEALPQTIDAQYSVGFNWERQYGFRVTKNFHDKFWIGASAENPETLNIAGHGLPNNYVIGQAGTSGGLYNAFNANYSYNLAPDMIAKIVAEPGWGHYEVWGVARFFRNRVYPNVTTVTSSTGTTTTTGSAVGAFNDSTVGGEVGGSLRVPTLHKRVDLGIKGAWGDGGNRYNNSGLADTTIRPNGQLALIHGYSGLGTVEIHATPRLDIYGNYGIDGTMRRIFVGGGKQTGYGIYTNVMTGCGTESIPAAGGNGFVPSSPTTNCTTDTRDIQEGTLGYWYDFYKGPKGRLRQGIQYSYLDRQFWSGIGSTPHADNNMVFTSFRYYLP
jgi:Skp family chaperone for outer membrane proteins